VYLGVGPEQNFTYIAALKPRIAFIIDIRAENRGLHLLYKALFELARNREEFVSLLFSRPKITVAATSTVSDLFAAIDPKPPTDARLSANLTRVFAVLRDRHHFALSLRDSNGLRHAYQEFARMGALASYSSPRVPTIYNTYRDVMQATDATGLPASYLASEARFQVVKDLEARNLVVPVVGDFSGPIALRAIGDWLRAHEANVTVFISRTWRTTSPEKPARRSAGTSRRCLLKRTASSFGRAVSGRCFIRPFRDRARPRSRPPRTPRRVWQPSRTWFPSRRPPS